MSEPEFYEFALIFQCLNDQLSTDPNNCAPILAPGASCRISFYTNSAVQFLASNISVKGTNTNATFFDLQAIQCIPQAQLLVSPTTLSFNIAAVGQITITNQSTAVDATNLSYYPQHQHQQYCC